MFSKRRSLADMPEHLLTLTGAPRMARFFNRRTFFQLWLPTCPCISAFAAPRLSSRFSLRCLPKQSLQLVYKK